MKPENFEELCERAVKAMHWRWMPGMLNRAGTRIVRVAEDGYMTGVPKGWTTVTVVDIFCPPDLSDPATFGCLLYLAREGHKKPDAIAKVRDGKAAVYYPIGSESWVRMSAVCESEMEALVNLLERPKTTI